MLTFCFRFRSFLLLFRFLSSASVLLPATWPLFLPFRSSWLCLTAASPSLRFRLRFHGFPRSSRPGFPCLCFPVFVLGFLFVSFHPTRLRSHSCSTGASLLFRFRFLFRAFPFPPLSFVRFGSVLTTQPSVSSFPLFPISSDGGSLGALWFLASPLLSSSVRPVSMPSFRFWYSASCDFLSPLAVSCHRHYSAAGLLFPARPSPLLSL